MDQPIDFEANLDGSIGQIKAISDTAKAWLDDNVQTESWQWLGDRLCIDRRYFLPLLEAIEEEGFNIANG